MSNPKAPATTKDMVTIVVPLSPRPGLTPDEEISLRHLRHFLGAYDKYLVAPKSLDQSYPDFAVEKFSDKYFGNPMAHAELNLFEGFYRRFEGYKYILMYHLDAFVFSDQLLQWREMDWDYIGGPWIDCDDTSGVTRPRVGNGGVALMKIESFLKVFNSKRYTIDPDEYWKRAYASEEWFVRDAALPKKYMKRVLYFNGARWEIARWTSQTDG